MDWVGTFPRELESYTVVPTLMMSNNDLTENPSTEFESYTVVPMLMLDG